MAHRSRLRLVGAVVAALSVLLAATAPLQAVTEAKEARMRFAYWTGCSPLKLFVSILTVEAARRMGLTEAAVATAVRSRLRAARIYTDTDNAEVPLLVAQVAIYYSEDQQIIGGAHHVRLSLYKHVHDPLSGLSGYAETKILPVGMLGVHDGKAAFILSGIAGIMDSFIDDYLRVNEPACSRSPINP